MLVFNGANSVHSIELQPHLCEQGQQSAKQQGLAMHFSQADVLKDDITVFSTNDNMQSLYMLVVFTSSF